MGEKQTTVWGGWSRHWGPNGPCLPLWDQPEGSGAG